jgi:hypothetical protein
MFDIGKLVWVWIKGEQPTTGPTALTFYLDYTYGSGSKDEEE